VSTAEGGDWRHAPNRRILTMSAGRAARRSSKASPAPGAMIVRMPDKHLWRCGPMGMDPALDAFRLPARDGCWWCGAPATTEEHRIKHSTLRRVALDGNGKIDPRNVFKKSPDFEGVLHSIKKGAQVRWRKNLCAECNNSRSQPFDLAYDVFEKFLVNHADVMMRWKRLDWSAVYGVARQEGARDLARYYFGKQIGCMLATQPLPVPEDLIGFLDGGVRCPSICFSVAISWRGGDAHRVMRRHGFDDGMSTFVGLLDSIAYASEGRLTGVDYGFHIGYVWLMGEWRVASDRTSWFELPSTQLARVNGGLRERLEWLPIRIQMESRHRQAPPGTAAAATATRTRRLREAERSPTP